MKKLFKHYYRPTESEFRKLWQSCFFALDANVLLNLYGYSEETREQLLTLLERLSSRIFMPFQFVLEYQRNRAHAIIEQVKNYAKAEKILEQFYATEILPRTKHPHLSQKAMKAFKLIQKELINGRKKHEALFADDPYFARVTSLVQNVGSPQPDLEKIFEQARRRYTARVPPGYADHKEKGEPEGFGDYVGWLQLLNFAKDSKKSAILITDDSKEDWWQIQGDRTIGPRPELLAEFQSECSQAFYIYSSDQFMRFANTFLKERVRNTAILEVQEGLQERLRSRSDRKSIASASIQPASDDKPILPIPPLEGQNLKPTVSEDERKEQKQAAKALKEEPKRG